MTRADIVRLVADVPVEAWADRFGLDSPREDVCVRVSPACFESIAGDLEPLPGHPSRVGLFGVPVEVAVDLPEGVSAEAGTGQHWVRG